MCNNKFFGSLLFVLFISVFIAGCGDKENVCRTCTATYRGTSEEIDSQEACSSAEEEAFKSEYSGVAFDVDCR